MKLAIGLGIVLVFGLLSALVEDKGKAIRFLKKSWQGAKR